MASASASVIHGSRCVNGSAGTGNPAREASSGNSVFRGAVAHVQTSGLKAAAHVSGMLPAPAAPAPKRAGVRDQFAFVSSIPFTRSNADRRNMMDDLSSVSSQHGGPTWRANKFCASARGAKFMVNGKNINNITSTPIDKNININSLVRFYLYIKLIITRNKFKETFNLLRLISYKILYFNSFGVGGVNYIFTAIVLLRHALLMLAAITNVLILCNLYVYAQ
ncbi:hypothetical protein ACFSLT_04170 [Novosphingobium resinovorum]